MVLKGWVLSACLRYLSFDFLNADIKYPRQLDNIDPSSLLYNIINLLLKIIRSQIFLTINSINYLQFMLLLQKIQYLDNISVRQLVNNRFLLYLFQFRLQSKNFFHLIYNFKLFDYKNIFCKGLNFAIHQLHFNLLTLIYFNALFPTIKVAIAIKITIIQGEIYLKEVEVAAIKSDLALPKRVLTVKISPLASREIRLYRCFHQNSLVFGWNSLPMFRRWCWRRPDFQWRLGNRWLLGLLQGTFLLGEESSGKWILLAHKKHQ